jgi:hypothetical protein
MNRNAATGKISRTSRTLAAIATLIGSLAGTMSVVAQTPEDTQAWEAQRAARRAQETLNAQLLAKQRQARKVDPMMWVRTLDPMPAGGWTFRAVGADGSWAAFSTDHQMKRSGHQVTMWLRQEYPEPQKTAGADMYWSAVQKLQFDCAKERARVLLVIYYSENNLAGSQQSEEADPKAAAWDPIVPGTQSDSTFHWACSTDH